MVLPQSPAQRVRPGTVTMAVYALYALAALQLIVIILQVASVGPTTEAIRDYGDEVGDSSTGDAIATTTQVISYVFVALSVLFAVGYVVLALLNNRGSNPARIVTWVVLGLSLCCGTLALAGTAGGSLMGGGGRQGELDMEEMQRRIENSLPDSYEPASLGLTVIGMLLGIAVIILLALPASNEFFRKPAAEWEPPVPGAVYPPPGAQSPGFQSPGFQSPGIQSPEYPPPPADPAPGTPPPAKED